MKYSKELVEHIEYMKIPILSAKLQSGSDIRHVIEELLEDASLEHIDMFGITAMDYIDRVKRRHDLRILYDMYMEEYTKHLDTVNEKN